MPYHARRPRGWLAPAVLAAAVVLVIVKRQQLLNASLGAASAASAPRSEWTSAELGVFPHHIPGEVRQLHGLPMRAGYRVLRSHVQGPERAALEAALFANLQP